MGADILLIAAWVIRNTTTGEYEVQKGAKWLINDELYL
jgi:hypothetical protein